MFFPFDGIHDLFIMGLGSRGNINEIDLFFFQQFLMRCVNFPPVDAEHVCQLDSFLCGSICNRNDFHIRDRFPPSHVISGYLPASKNGTLHFSILWKIPISHALPH
jgi:hypothetical protein